MSGTADMLRRQSEERARLRKAVKALKTERDALKVEVLRLRAALSDYADHAEDSGWGNLAREIRRLRYASQPEAAATSAAEGVPHPGRISPES